MALLFVILLIIAALVLGFFVLIQNPKGGGLASGMGISNQFMGVKQTTDFLEKGTWYTLAALVALTLLSYVLVKSSGQGNSELNKLNVDKKAAAQTLNNINSNKTTDTAAGTTNVTAVTGTNTATGTSTSN